MYNGYQNFQQPYNFSLTGNAPQSNLLRVNGMEGAKAYQMNPNSTVALFDSNEDIFYIKTSDAGGFPSLKAYKFTEYAPESKVPISADYVTRKEFEELKESIVDGKFNIHKSDEHKSNGYVQSTKSV